MKSGLGIVDEVMMAVVTIEMLSESVVARKKVAVTVMVPPRMGLSRQQICHKSWSMRNVLI